MPVRSGIQRPRSSSQGGEDTSAFRKGEEPTEIEPNSQACLFRTQPHKITAKKGTTESGSDNQVLPGQDADTTKFIECGDTAQLSPE